MRSPKGTRTEIRRHHQQHRHSAGFNHGELTDKLPNRLTSKQTLLSVWFFRRGCWRDEGQNSCLPENGHGTGKVLWAGGENRHSIWGPGSVEPGRNGPDLDRKTVV